MDPYDFEKTSLEYQGMRQADAANARILDKMARLNAIASDTARYGRDKLQAVTKRKQPALRGFTREEPWLTRRRKVGIGLGAVFGVLFGGLLWRRRKRQQ